MISWMIYGANGYTGELIAREARRREMTPVLAGRDRAKVERLARELELPFRVFAFDDPKTLQDAIRDVGLVLNCAGPFSATSAPLIEACLAVRAHYLDITGEIAALEHAHSLHGRATEAGVVLCPGVGFDVIPTDCVASALKAAMPNATHLALGFDSGSGLSPGTAKTAIEGLADGGRVRRDGRIVEVPLAWKSRRIDFGRGEKSAMTIPWGDVSTAYHSTGIPNIEVYLPAPERMIAMVRRTNRLRWLLGFGAVQRFLKRRVEKSIKGPDEAARSASPTFVWGEVTNALGQKKTARIVTANGYALTVTGALAVVEAALGGGHA
ncbi:MAG: saccharopine dehydrogenase NADP-binding domain-containing protein, partial [Mesorhizobium sp.]|nr:saccharopine dehydrogenase NADP-binding domain-containing protein [Mesorhizobium sp.]